MHPRLKLRLDLVKALLKHLAVIVLLLLRQRYHGHFTPLITLQIRLLYALLHAHLLHYISALSQAEAASGAALRSTFVSRRVRSS